MADNFLNYTGLGYFKDKCDAEYTNVIETVKVNGSALTPDANKAVDVTVPTKTSDLTNDGDGQSNFATEAYVAQEGGKIDVIKVNGTTQTITNKTVDITVPTKTSDLNNDSDFQTDSDVASAISDALSNSGDPYQTESDVDDKIAAAQVSVLDYKGAVPTYADLPSSGQKKGDVWDVQDTGINYAWSGTAWDALGTSVDTSAFWTSTTGQTNTLVAITTSQIDALFA